MARFGPRTFMGWNIMTGPVLAFAGVFGGVTFLTVAKEMMTGKPAIKK